MRHADANDLDPRARAAWLADANDDPVGVLDILADHAQVTESRIWSEA